MEKKLDLTKFQKDKMLFKKELTTLMIKHKVTYIGDGSGMNPDSPWSYKSLTDAPITSSLNTSHYFRVENGIGLDNKLWIDFEFEKIKNEVDPVMDQISNLSRDQLIEFIIRIDKAMLLGIDQSKL